MITFIKNHSSLFILLVCICVSLQSCSREEAEPVLDQQVEVLTRSDGRDIPETKFDVTQRMAKIFISSNKENPPIVSMESYGIDGVTCFYIFNFEKGFKVISADTRVQPILAESDRDNIDPEKTDNPGVKYWLEDTAERIREIKENDIDTGEDYSALWSAYRLPREREMVNTRSNDEDSIWVLVYDSSTDVLYNNADVGPLLYTRWGQGSPWNSKMPTVNGTKCLTGCVAVAAAQILYYFHHKNNTPKDFWNTISIQSTSICPSHGGVLVTLSKTNYSSNSYKWSNMAEDVYGLNTDYVSELMLDLGERLEMHYGTSASMVFHAADLSIPRLSNCGIGYTYDTYTFTKVKNDALALKPVIISGWNSSSGSNGHTWVIDGCKDYSIRYTSTVAYHCIHPDQLVSYPSDSEVLSYDEMMSMYPDASGGVYILSNTVTYDNQQSLHMNWGWGGSNDGWYNLLNNEWQSYPYNRVIHYNLSTSQLN